MKTLRRVCASTALALIVSATCFAQCGLPSGGVLPRTDLSRIRTPALLFLVVWAARRR
jgi:hypothetical protein